MNKYQEALNRLCCNTDYNDYSNQTINEVSEDIVTLQQLIDKETPKKTIKLPYKDIYGNKIGDSKTHFFNACPNCKGNVGIQAEYCRHCGQKLEWDED